MTEIYGIIAAMVTPMHSDETLNTQELRKQTERMIYAGLHGLFCLGTNGEAYALNSEEKCTVIETVVNQCAGRIPVYAGVGCITTAETVQMAKTAQQIGADVLSVISPWFAQSSQESLYRHFVTVADAVSIPLSC